MSDTTRVTVDLSARDHERLSKIAEEGGATKASILREALNLYNLICGQMNAGKTLYTIDESGKREKLRLFLRGNNP